jgi:multisubunit Na+/H+ antiporter MnhE subunit
MSVTAWPFFAAGTAIWWALAGWPSPPLTVVALAVLWTGWRLFARVMGGMPMMSVSQLARFGRGIGVYLGRHVAPDILRSTAVVIREVVRRHPQMRPAIVAVPLPGATTAGLTVMAYGISLTPGQQIVAIDEARAILYVHALDVPDPAALQAQIQALYRTYVEEATR